MEVWKEEDWEDEDNMSSSPTGCCAVHFTGVGLMFTMDEDSTDRRKPGSNKSGWKKS